MGADENLNKVEHIVVLMMENRSFDHMLGYLSLPADEKWHGASRTDVDGLKPGYGNKDSSGQFHEIEPLGTRFLHEKVLDPGHGEDDVEKQLEGEEDNEGFLRNYEVALEQNKERLLKKYREKHDEGVPWPEDLDFDPTRVLGYQHAEDVPVYDYIAREFTVCDRWFCSVPGPTWENRLYATTGCSGPKTPPDLRDFPFSEKLQKKLSEAPFYDRRAFTHQLGDEDWRWYSHDPATLRLVDSAYRPFGRPGTARDANFAPFNRTSLWEWSTFVSDWRSRDPGQRRKVSWIDPNFVDFREGGPAGSNDDHPPSRVMLGQDLVLTVLESIARSDAWDRTMLLIVYDEHGGLYDHVKPSKFAPTGEKYGARIPALVVSPYAPAGVCDTTFDHTSIIKTILTRFAAEPSASLDAMESPRTSAASHLGEALTVPANEPRPGPAEEDLRDLREKVNEWKDQAEEAKILEKPKALERFFEFFTNRQEEASARDLEGEEFTELQADMVDAARVLRATGVPPGKR